MIVGRLHFYRDSAGNEVDLVCSLADRLIGIEIKAGAMLLIVSPRRPDSGIILTK